MEEHKRGEGGKFSRKYKMKKLVYYEVFGDIKDAIAREKQIKAGSRMSKLKLIESHNPEWNDLALDMQP